MITKNPPKKQKSMTTKYITQDLVKKLLFQQIERPKNLSNVKIVNVYDHKYRINLYITYEENNLTKTKISQSYFCSLDTTNQTLTILR
jgi:hypothetical protein